MHKSNTFEVVDKNLRKSLGLQNDEARKSTRNRLTYSNDRYNIDDFEAGPYNS